jgi:DNA-binding CsgD family transcriptional regulator
MQPRGACAYSPFGVSSKDVTRLTRADLRAVLDFLGDVSTLEFDELYPTEFLARMRGLVDCDAVTYSELDRARRVHFAGVGVPEDDDEDPGVDIYWNVVHTCPTFDFRDRTGDLGSIRVSDVISRRRYHELPIYADYFRPCGLDQYVELGLPAQPGRDRFFVLFRSIGARDFSARDRDVLEMLRPHIKRLEANASLRRQLSEVLRQSNGALEWTDHAHLTPREREIVELVAEGKTNAEIAAILWVAPSTVKKHLEHVYAKTGVGRRAAAARHVWVGGPSLPGA